MWNARRALLHDSAGQHEATLPKRGGGASCYGAGWAASAPPRLLRLRGVCGHSRGAPARADAGAASGGCAAGAWGVQTCTVAREALKAGDAALAWPAAGGAEAGASVQRWPAFFHRPAWAARSAAGEPL